MNIGCIRTLHELFGQLGSEKLSFQQNPITSEQLGSLIDLLQESYITGNLFL